eukprot:gene20485-31544_t
MPGACLAGVALLAAAAAAAGGDACRSFQCPLGTARAGWADAMPCRVVDSLGVCVPWSVENAQLCCRFAPVCASFACPAGTAPFPPRLLNRCPELGVTMETCAADSTSNALHCCVDAAQTQPGPPTCASFTCPADTMPLSPHLLSLCPDLDATHACVAHSMSNALQCCVDSSQPQPGLPVCASFKCPVDRMLLSSHQQSPCPEVDSTRGTCAAPSLLNALHCCTEPVQAPPRLPRALSQLPANCSSYACPDYYFHNETTSGVLCPHLSEDGKCGYLDSVNTASAACYIGRNQACLKVDENAEACCTRVNIFPGALCGPYACPAPGVVSWHVNSSATCYVDDTGVCPQLPENTRACCLETPAEPTLNCFSGGYVCPVPQPLTHLLHVNTSATCFARAGEESCLEVPDNTDTCCLRVPIAADGSCSSYACPAQSGFVLNASAACFVDPDQKCALVDENTDACCVPPPSCSSYACRPPSRSGYSLTLNASARCVTPVANLTGCAETQQNTDACCVRAPACASFLCPGGLPARAEYLPEGSTAGCAEASANGTCLQVVANYEACCGLTCAGYSCPGFGIANDTAPCPSAYWSGGFCQSPPSVCCAAPMCSVGYSCPAPWVPRDDSAALACTDYDPARGACGPDNTQACCAATCQRYACPKGFYLNASALCYGGACEPSQANDDRCCVDLLTCTTYPCGSGLAPKKGGGAVCVDAENYECLITAENTARCCEAAGASCGGYACGNGGPTSSDECVVVDSNGKCSPGENEQTCCSSPPACASYAGCPTFVNETASRETCPRWTRLGGCLQSAENDVACCARVLSPSCALLPCEVYQRIHSEEKMQDPCVDTLVVSSRGDRLCKESDRNYEDCCEVPCGLVSGAMCPAASVLDYDAACEASIGYRCVDACCVPAALTCALFPCPPGYPPAPDVAACADTDAGDGSQCDLTFENFEACCTTRCTPTACPSPTACPAAAAERRGYGGDGDCCCADTCRSFSACGESGWVLIAQPGLAACPVQEEARCVQGDPANRAACCRPPDTAAVQQESWRGGVYARVQNALPELSYGPAFSEAVDSMRASIANDTGLSCGANGLAVTAVAEAGSTPILNVRPRPGCRVIPRRDDLPAAAALRGIEVRSVVGLIPGTLVSPAWTEHGAAGAVSPASHPLLFRAAGALLAQKQPAASLRVATAAWDNQRHTLSLEIASPLLPPEGRYTEEDTPPADVEAARREVAAIFSDGAFAGEMAAAFDLPTGHGLAPVAGVAPAGPATFCAVRDAVDLSTGAGVATAAVLADALGVSRNSIVGFRRPLRGGAAAAIRDASGAANSASLCAAAVARAAAGRAVSLTTEPISGVWPGVVAFTVRARDGKPRVPVSPAFEADVLRWARAAAAGAVPSDAFVHVKVTPVRGAPAVAAKAAGWELCVTEDSALVEIAIVAYDPLALATAGSVFRGASSSERVKADAPFVFVPCSGAVHYRPAAPRRALYKARVFTDQVTPALQAGAYDVARGAGLSTQQVLSFSEATLEFAVETWDETTPAELSARLLAQLREVDAGVWSVPVAELGDDEVALVEISAVIDPSSPVVLPPLLSRPAAPAAPASELSLPVLAVVCAVSAVLWVAVGCCILRACRKYRSAAVKPAAPPSSTKPRTSSSPSPRSSKAAPALPPPGEGPADALDIEMVLVSADDDAKASTSCSTENSSNGTTFLNACAKVLSFSEATLEFAVDTWDETELSARLLAQLREIDAGVWSVPVAELGDDEAALVEISALIDPSSLVVLPPLLSRPAAPAAPAGAFAARHRRLLRFVGGRREVLHPPRLPQIRQEAEAAPPLPPPDESPADDSMHLTMVLIAADDDTK